MPEKSALHDRTARAGAEFVVDAGWLMPGRFGDIAAEYRAARDGAAVFDLSHRGKVEAAGPDAIKFIQNLSTNDVSGLAPGMGCEDFFTNIHAKAIAHGFVYRLPKDSALWMDTVPGLGEKLIKHLDHYLISEQVELTDRTRDWVQLLVAGPQARSIIAGALGGESPELQPLQHTLHAGCPIRRNDTLGLPGYVILCAPDRSVALWEGLLKAGGVPGGLDAYELLRVEAGTPVYGKDFDETNIALEVGRTKQAVCYTKGCFLGQEPLVRIRDLGHVNRMLLGVKAAENEPLPRGAKLFRDGKEVGHVTSSVVSPRLGAAVALAYLRRGSQEPGAVVEVETSAGRARAEVASLPFSF